MTITLACQRIEVEFFDDHIEYSVFSGDESVMDEPKPLMERLIAGIE